MPDLSLKDLDQLARQDEAQYVHQVYETIASHFSSTRYKPWPGITQFFESLPSGSLGLDAGCGNGKYLGLRSVLQNHPSGQETPRPATSSKGKGRAVPVDPSVPGYTEEGPSKALDFGAVLTIGLDYSTNLVKIAKDRSHEVLVGDAIDMPWRDGTFDFAISIATIHHFTTPSRRVAAVRTMLRALNKKHGKLIIQVWAVEQTPPPDSGSSLSGSNGLKPYMKRQRDMDKLESATSTLQSLKLSEAEKQDVFVPWKLQSGQRLEGPADKEVTNKSEPPEEIYQRYYHLFKGGELRAMLRDAAEEELSQEQLRSFEIDAEETWESGNWSIVGRFLVDSPH